MRRRDFLTLLVGTAAVLPIAARAQQAGAVRRVGVLINGDENDPRSRSNVASLTQVLRKLGWIEGQNLRMEVRWNAGDADALRDGRWRSGSLSQTSRPTSWEADIS
jgi:putative ABC transport system substrate-binding protein